MTSASRGDKHACGLLREMQHGNASIRVVLKTMPEEDEFDSLYFRGKFAEKGKSYADYARERGYDPSVVSRMLTGKRKIHREEAADIADFIGVPVKEVLKHARITIDGDLPSVLLIATINEHGFIEHLPEPRSLPQAVIDQAKSAIATLPRVLAAQIRAPSGPLAVMDDAVVLFGHTDDIDPSAVGVLSICRNSAGEFLLAKIERARKTGESRVVTIDGKTKEFDLQTATPVITIIP